MFNFFKKKAKETNSDQPVSKSVELRQKETMEPGTASFIKEENRINRTSVKAPKEPVDYKNYELPSVNLLSQTSRPSREEIAAVREKGEFISGVFNTAGITCDFIEGSINESITTIKLNLKRKGDLQRYLDAVDVLKRNPGYQNVFCYSVGNEDNTIIILLIDESGLKLSTILSKDYGHNKMAYALGEDFYGNPVFGDLTKNRNLLITGRGMCGKTTLIQSMLISLLMKNKPDELKLVIADSSVLNYVYFKDVPHLMWPIINIETSDMFTNLVKKLYAICEERRNAFATAGVRSIDGFNDFVEEQTKSGNSVSKMPYIAVVIDEIDPLMASANKKEFVSNFVALATISSTVGVSLIVVTKNFDRGTYYDDIRRLFNGRISYAAATTAQSRVALETEGAEALSFNGEIMYRETGFSNAQMLITPVLSDKEMQDVCKYIKSQAKPEYEDSYFEFLTNYNGTALSNGSEISGYGDENDSLYDDVVEFVRLQQKASTSLLQRRFGIGYNRAARLIDTLEDKRIIGPADGAKPRDVYIK